MHDLLQQCFWRCSRGLSFNSTFAATMLLSSFGNAYVSWLNTKKDSRVFLDEGRVKKIWHTVFFLEIRDRVSKKLANL